MRLMMMVLLTSPLALGKEVNIRCNVISQCQIEWESPFEHSPPRIKLACQSLLVQAKISIQQESQWQKISYDF